MKSKKLLLIAFVIWSAWGMLGIPFVALLLPYTGYRSNIASHLLSMLSSALTYIPYLLIVIGLKPAPNDTPEAAPLMQD